MFYVLQLLFDHKLPIPFKLVPSFTVRSLTRTHWLPPPPPPKKTKNPKTKQKHIHTHIPDTIFIPQKLASNLMTQLISKSLLYTQYSRPNYAILKT